MLDFIYLLNLKSWNDWYQERLFPANIWWKYSLSFKRILDIIISNFKNHKYYSIYDEQTMFSFHCTNSTLSHAQVGHLSVHLLKNGFKAHIHFFGDLDYRFFFR